jgi:putative YhdH/YhfP family quinone oxidoreductase
MALPDRFPALLVEKDESGFRFGEKELTPADLPQGEVTIEVRYSAVNFKDGLATIPKGNVARGYPLVPGIDLGGVVVESEDGRFRAGDQVVATGQDLGVAHHGGYAAYARLPGDWVFKLPRGLDLRQAIALGTAGVTAAEAILRFEREGLRKEMGPVLVTGATGGVGCLAVDMLAGLGYTVEASTGKPEAEEFLRALGAQAIVPRAELQPESPRPLDRQRWAAAIDPVGGRTLATVLSRLRYGGLVASVGLTAGSGFETSVFPFILRNATLFGVESAYLPRAEREVIWRRMSDDLRPAHLDSLITHEIAWPELPAALERILQGGVTGRIVVALP